MAAGDGGEKEWFLMTWTPVKKESRGRRGDVKNVGGVNQRCRERRRRREDEREEDGAAL
jgi:hypothetical protein